MLNRWSIYQNASSWWCLFWPMVEWVKCTLEFLVFKNSKIIFTNLQRQLLCPCEALCYESWLAKQEKKSRLFIHPATMLEYFHIQPFFLFYLPVLFSFLVCFSVFRQDIRRWVFLTSACYGVSDVRSGCNSIALSILSYFWNCLNSCCAVLEVVYNISFSFRTCDLSKPIMSLML